MGGNTREPLPAKTAFAEIVGGEEQSFVPNRDIPEQWWTLFRSQPLNSLVEKAIKANPTLVAAQAALRQAVEFVYAQEGAFFPTLQASFSPSRQKASNTFSPPLNTDQLIYSLFTTQVTVGFTPDVFGGNRRQVESLKAQVDFQRFQLQAAYLTLTSNVVGAAVQEASLKAKLAAAKEIIQIITNSLGLVRRQFDLGYAARIDVAAQEAALAQAEQALPPLQKQLEQNRDLLAALAGGFPSDDLEEKFDLSALQLPEELPVSLPSKFVEHRPDVRVVDVREQFVGTGGGSGHGHPFAAVRSTRTPPRSTGPLVTPGPTPASMATMRSRATGWTVGAPFFFSSASACPSSSSACTPF